MSKQQGSLKPLSLEGKPGREPPPPPKEETPPVRRPVLDKPGEEGMRSFIHAFQNARSGSGEVHARHLTRLASQIKVFLTNKGDSHESLIIQGKSTIKSFMQPIDLYIHENGIRVEIGNIPPFKVTVEDVMDNTAISIVQDAICQLQPEMREWLTPSTLAPAQNGEDFQEDFSI